MRVLQLISGISFILLALVKLKIVMIEVDDHIVHYLFNASLMLTVFSVIFPLVSYAKLKRMNVREDKYLGDILSKIDRGNQTPIYVSNKHLKNNAAALYSKNEMVIVCGEKLVETMDDEHLTFLIAHEYDHIKNNHLIKNVLSFIFVLSGVPIALLLITSLLGSTIPLVPILIFAFGAYVTSFILHFVFSQRREYHADQFASSYVGETAAIDALKKLKESKSADERSYSLFATHPSIEKRIRRVS